MVGNILHRRIDRWLVNHGDLVRIDCADLLDKLRFERRCDEKIELGFPVARQIFPLFWLLNIELFSFATVSRLARKQRSAHDSKKVQRAVLYSRYGNLGDWNQFQKTAVACFASR